MRRGEISVFLSLILVVLMSLFLTLAESAKMQFAKSMSRGLSDMAVESMFGEYQRELLAEYEILAIDGGYGAGRFSEENLLAHDRKYLSCHTEPDAALVAAGLRYDFGISPGSTQITSLTLLTDQNGAYFRSQISRFMKDKYGISFVEDLLEKAGPTEELTNMQQVYQETSVENAQTLNSLEQAKEDSEIETDEEAEKLNPLNDVARLKSTSILHLVLADASGVSENKLTDQANLPSMRPLRSGFGEPVRKAEETAADQILFREYLLQHTANFCTADNSETKALQYELEYILVGKDNDIENMESIAGRLLLAREALNFAYLCSDTAKMAEAEALAIAIVGYFGIPPLITATKWALLLGWAYAESILDVRTLFAGGKVPLVKTAENWEADLSGIADLISGYHLRSDMDEGLDYNAYLRVLLYLGNIKGQTLRFMDLAERRVRLMTNNPSFAIDDCVVGIEMLQTWEIGEGITYSFPVYYAYQ